MTISLIQFPQLYNVLLSACVDLNTDQTISGFLQAITLICFRKICKISSVFKTRRIEVIFSMEEVLQNQYHDRI